MHKSYMLIIVFFMFSYSCSRCSSKLQTAAADGSQTDSIRTIKSGLNYPWEILWGPDNYIWMTERGGKISRVNPTTGTVKPVYTIAEVVSNGEGGLLGMVLHPDFSSKPYW